MSDAIGPLFEPPVVRRARKRRVPAAPAAPSSPATPVPTEPTARPGRGARKRPPAGERKREGLIQDEIRLALGEVPGLVLWRNNIGEARYGEARVPYGVGGDGGADLIGCYRGRFLAVEIKTPTGRQSPEQITFAACVERNGGEYVVLRSVEDARAWLADLRRRHG